MEFVIISILLQTKASDALGRFPPTKQLVKESNEASLNVIRCVLKKNEQPPHTTQLEWCIYVCNQSNRKKLDYCRTDKRARIRGLAPTTS